MRWAQLFSSHWAPLLSGNNFPSVCQAKQWFGGCRSVPRQITERKTGIIYGYRHGIWVHKYILQRSADGLQQR